MGCLNLITILILCASESLFAQERTVPSPVVLSFDEMRAIESVLKYYSDNSIQPKPINTAEVGRIVSGWSNLSAKAQYRISQIDVLSLWAANGNTFSQISVGGNTRRRKEELSRQMLLSAIDHALEDRGVNREDRKHKLAKLAPDGEARCFEADCDPYGMAYRLWNTDDDPEDSIYLEDSPQLIKLAAEIFEKFKPEDVTLITAQDRQAALDKEEVQWADNESEFASQPADTEAQGQPKNDFTIRLDGRDKIAVDLTRLKLPGISGEAHISMSCFKNEDMLFQYFSMLSEVLNKKLSKGKKDKIHYIGFGDSTCTISTQIVGAPKAKTNPSLIRDLFLADKNFSFAVMTATAEILKPLEKADNYSPLEMHSQTNLKPAPVRHWHTATATK